MSTQRLNSSIDYRIDGQALQLILQPHGQLSIEQQSLIFFSDGINVKDENTWVDRILKKQSISTVTNIGSTPTAIGLAGLETGPVMTVILEPNQVKKVFISKDCLLCSVDKINSTLLPLNFTINRSMLTSISVMFLAKLPSLLNSFYLVEKKSTNEEKTSVFIQSGSEILVKELKADEHLIFNSYCLVAFDDTIKLELTDKSVGVTQLSLRCSGPGFVYFSSQSIKRKNVRKEADKAIIPLLSFVGVLLNFIIAILSFYTVTTILTKLAEIVPSLDINETVAKAFNFRGEDL